MERNAKGPFGSVFKQQFSVFLKIHVGEKVCKNTYNVA